MAIQFWGLVIDSRDAWCRHHMVLCLFISCFSFGEEDTIWTIAGSLSLKLDALKGKLGT
jgi:hypothetical protein